MCPEWFDSFENFIADMGERPSDRHSIDRINNSGNYSKDNCRWADPHEQAVNRSTNRLVVGVSQRSANSYAVNIEHKGERIYLGSFSSEVLAAKAYDDKCEEIHGYRLNQERGVY